MTFDEYKATYKDMPATPGVYFFFGPQKKLLYIGKATSLKHRVRSYFAPDLKEKRSQLIENMVTDAVSIEWTATDSVLEALILETNLIRTHKPRCNTRSKDDKSYNHLVITKEQWPRVLVIRGKDLHERFETNDIQYHFGPFPSGQLFREALKIVRKIFRFYDTPIPVGEERTKLERGKIDFNRQIGLYPEAHEHAEYVRTIRHIKLLFQGKKPELIRELEREMKALAKIERFEEANMCKRRIFALTHIEDVALIKYDSERFAGGGAFRIEAYDVAHMGGKNMVGVMTVIEDGQLKKSDYRKFTIKSLQDANDPAALRELLSRRLQHPEWPLPQLIVVDGGTAQVNSAERTISETNLAIPVVAVLKDERHKPKDILGNKTLINLHKLEILHANAEAHRFSIAFHRLIRGRAQLTPTPKKTRDILST
ncbi:GIY-YIG nuclease family protein [Patescibacteria group bacterium]|nr:GIY-YIG nuclease family protein [Patescibacteria group bacterium]